MNRTRWTLGVVLAATVSLWGLVEADASPFSSYILSDDLGNTVRGSAAEPSEWDEGSESVDDGETTDNDGSASGGGDSSGADSSDDGSGDTTDGKDNNGHGNNEDGVDSSNKGNSKTGEDTNCDADGICVDDEIKSGGSETTTTTTETKTNNGKAKGKDK